MRSLRDAVRNLIAWAVVEDDGANRGPVPVQQIRTLGQSGRSVEWYPYGFFATAPPGSRAVRAMLSELPDALVHFPGSPESRPDHASGEVGVYHPESGSFVIFRRDGSVEVSARADLVASVGGSASLVAAGAVAATAGTTATVTAPTIALVGNVGVTGNLDQDGANLGFRGSAPVPKAVINGTKTGGTAQNQLLQALDALGLIDDQT